MSKDEVKYPGTWQTQNAKVSQKLYKRRYQQGRIMLVAPAVALVGLIWVIFHYHLVG